MDARATIKHAAFALFRVNGFAKTSYSAIARRSGCGRPLVQYHFPKKDDLLVEFISDVMTEIDLELSSELRVSPNNPQRTLLFGQIYYATLLLDEGMRTLALDMLGNRDITTRIIRANAEATVPAESDEAQHALTLRASALATGATYELLYTALKDGATVSAVELSAINVALYEAILEDAPYSASLTTLLAEAFPEEHARSAAEAVLARVLR